MTRERCDHCYRWATSTVYRRSRWRRLIRRPAESARVCTDHLDLYRRKRRFGRGR